MSLNIVEVLRDRELEREDKIIDRALRPYLLYDLDDHGHLLGAIEVFERVTEILGRYGYDLVDVAFTCEGEPTPRAPRVLAVDRHVSWKERQELAREVRAE